MEQATTNWKNSGEVKRREETPVHMSYQPRRTLHAGTHLGWVMLTPPGRTLSQKDWPETTWKLTQHHKTWDCEPRGRAVLLGSLTLLLSTQAPLPNTKSLALSACVSPWTIHFWVLDKTPLSGPGRGPPSCNSLPFLLLTSYLSFHLGEKFVITD